MRDRELKRNQNAQAENQNGGGKPGESLSDQLWVQKGGACSTNSKTVHGKGWAERTYHSHFTFTTVLKLHFLQKKSGSGKSKIRKITLGASLPQFGTFVRNTKKQRHSSCLKLIKQISIIKDELLTDGINQSKEHLVYGDSWLQKELFFINFQF